MKKKWIFLIIIIGLLLVLFGRNEWSPLLLQKATYGMPALAAKGEVSDLYIGSSMFRQGLEIGVLAEKNEDPYILAYNGNEPVLELLELENLINQGVKIEKLYVDLYVYSAFEEPELSDEKLLMELNFKGKARIWDLIKTREDTSKAETFWRIFVNGNNELLLTWPISGRLIDSQFDRGGTLTRQTGVSEEKLESLHVPGISGEMNLQQKEAIEGIIRLAEREGIELVFVETPKYQKVVEDEAYQNAMKRYTELLAEQGVAMLLSAETAARLGCDAKTYEFDHSDANSFLDLLHLSCDGRVLFSNQIE